MSPLEQPAIIVTNKNVTARTVALISAFILLTSYNVGHNWRDPTPNE
jgi:hypothetical protein